jgi:D-aminopeptidase
VPGGRRPRAREIGLGVGRFPTGTWNAITDVDAVRVGHATLITGSGPLRPGRGPVRTGVTAIVPREDLWHRKLPAGGAVLNGCGELTGLAWILESGFLEVPVLFTNTHSVGQVMDGVVTWMQRVNPAIGVTENVVTPVVGECDDSTLSDIRGRHVTEPHVHRALDGARGGPVDEGSVGAGTGMISFGFKAGIGTSSRLVGTGGRTFRLGALVVSNFGSPDELIIGGAPVGRPLMQIVHPAQRPRDGSIQVILATDAPLDARQLTRLARRSAIGMARIGHRGHDGSGDFAIAFSTAHTIPAETRGRRLSFSLLSDLDIDPLFEAAADCVQESILNALCRADRMEGRDGHVAPALPLDALRSLLARGAP